MRLFLPICIALTLSAAAMGCRRPAPPVAPPASPTPTPDLPWRPPPGSPSLAPQATPGSQAPGLNDQQRVERLFQEAN